MSHFVYVISAAEGPVKIGHSSDPERRLGQLQTGHPDPLFLRHSEPVAPERAELIEGLVHRHNSHRRSRREWFDMTVSEAVLEVQWAVIRYEDNPIAGKFR